MKITILLLLISIHCHSQKYEDAQAQAIDFLNTLKFVDVPEGEEKIRALAYRSATTFPVISEANILHENQQATEIESVKGYKALVEVKALNKLGTVLTKRFILISYFNTLKNAWQVFEFRENIDIPFEVQSARAAVISTTDSRKLQYRLRNLAYWLIMSGKLSEAKQMCIQAQDVATADVDATYTTDLGTVVDAITPKKS